MRTVDQADWATTVALMRDEGFGFLDFLTGIDRLDEIEVVAHLFSPGSGEHELVSTRVPAGRPHLASLTTVMPAASWHERETAEMFGVVFDGHPDPRPLLLRSGPAVPPLRKDAPLAERVETPWPGAADPATARRSRRRQVPPGVRESWLAGDGQPEGGLAGDGS